MLAAFLFPVPFSVALLNTVIYVYSTMTYSTVMSTYALGLYAIQLRVDLLNQHIRKLEQCPTDRVRLLQRIGLIYERLTEIGGVCNVCFALPVMMSTLLAFGYNIICVYVVFKSLADVTTLSGVHVAVNVSWNVFFLGFVMLVVLAGSELAHTGKDTGQVIHYVLNTMQHAVGTDVVRQQLVMLSLQVLHKHPVASAGLFHFDWTLVYAVWRSSKLASAPELTIVCCR